MVSRRLAGSGWHSECAAMAITISNTDRASSTAVSTTTRGERITSIDALRGLVMFTMIFVNDLAGAPQKIVPAWMRHYHGKSGMTFVDLVFPAFLFIVGMSIPFALGSRLERGEPVWKTILHILIRTGSLLFIGILMVHETPDSAKLGWSGALWSTLMFFSAILAFSALSPRRSADDSGERARTLSIISSILRCVGLISLVWLTLAFRGEKDQRIVILSPFSIDTSWYGILGLIAWAYLVCSVLFLVFRSRPTALLGCLVLLLCLYPADQKGAFKDFWLSNYVGIGEMLGSHPAITMGGVFLATILLDPARATVRERARFTLLFMAACSAGALLLHGLYGINKNNATPSWCLWACAVTAGLWLVFYLLADARPNSSVTKLAKPFAVTGQNVLLAYLLSEMLPSALDLFHLDDAYASLAQPSLACSVARSAGCATVLLTLTALLNRFGFRLKL
jgi:heparan-alpha-glucosaminide N-acetyltransferase